jgi:hypothetical protein
MNSELSLTELENCIEKAYNNGARYIGVKIQMEGFEQPEIIINQRDNFKSKLAYYKKAYNEDLTLKTFNGIKIIGFDYADSYEKLEYSL